MALGPKLRAMQVPAETPEPVTHEARIEAPAHAAQRLADALEETHNPSPVAVGLFQCGDGRFEVFAHYQEPPPREGLLKLIADAAGGDRLGPLRIEAIPAADWVTLSQGQRGQVEAGRFLVHGSHDRGNVVRRPLTIEIDAGQAFGTGHHASTLGCLVALDDLLKRCRPRNIVDLGTGSGILAIAAAKALKANLMASDQDPVAAATAAANARLNGVASFVSVVAADGFAHARFRHKRFDLVFANLLERALYELAPALARHVAPGGVAILSGLTQTQARKVEACMRAHGFALAKRILIDGWVTLVVLRRGARRVND